ncbi:MAG: oligosaccharide flippase family protein [Thaumarchaeota archaeon]|nr:oligosaccharide flippase family protein [Nitrososphaerota archaeon]
MHDGSEASVARGATSIYFSSIVLLLVNTAYFATVTNILPTAQIGVLAALQIIIFGVATLANLSLPQTIMTSMPLPPAVAKLIPEFLSSGQHGKGVQVFRISLLISIAISTVSALALFFSAGWLVNSVFQSQVDPNWLIMTSLDLWFYTLGQLLMMTLIGLNKTAKAGIYYTISFLVKYAASMGLVLVGAGITGVLAAWIVGDAVMVVVCAANARSFALGSAEKVSRTEVIKYSAPVLVSSLVVFGVSQVDRLFALGRFTLSDLGIYNVAVAASTIAAFAPNAIAIALIPSLSTRFSEGSLDGFLSLAKRYTRYVSLVAIPMSFQIAALATPLTHLFGTQYIQAATSATIISTAIGITAVSSIHNGCLLASQNANKVMRANIFGLLVFAIFVTSLASFLGFEALAWSRAVMMLAITLAVEFYAYKQGFLVVDWRAYLSSFAGSALMSVVLLVLVNFIGGYLRLIALLPLLISLGIVVYFVVLRLIKTFNKEDMDFLRSLLPQKLGFLVSWAARIMGVADAPPQKED